MANISVTFRHMEPSNALKEYAIEKISKVSKVLDEAFDAHITLAVEKIRQIAEVQLSAKGFTIKAFESTDDLYSAIDLVADKIDRKVKKYRERRKDHGAGEAHPPIVSGSSMTIRHAVPEIIRADVNFVPKPMTVEDAATHLDILKLDVVLFVNSETNQTSVVFRQHDGNIGFSEPTT